MDTGHLSSGCETRCFTGPSAPLRQLAALHTSLGARKVVLVERGPVSAMLSETALWYSTASTSLRSSGVAAAFKGYLGEDKEAWKQYDATELVQELGYPSGRSILIDVGTADKFLESQLQPERFRTAAQSSKVEVAWVTVRRM